MTDNVKALFFRDFTYSKCAWGRPLYQLDHAGANDTPLTI
jgi:hypothetical protein